MRTDGYAGRPQGSPPLITSTRVPTHGRVPRHWPLMLLWLVSGQATHVEIYDLVVFQQFVSCTFQAVLAQHQDIGPPGVTQGGPMSWCWARTAWKVQDTNCWKTTRS